MEKEAAPEDDTSLEAKLKDRAWYDIYLQAYNPTTHQYLVQVSRNDR